MDINESMKIKFHFLDVVRKEYESKFGNREWDGMALNYYYFKKKPFKVIFSWTWSNRNGESLIAEIGIDNENGGNKLYEYLKENASTLNSYEWFVMPGRSRIMYEIKTDVNVGSLLTNKFYMQNLVEAAVNGMHLLEEDFLYSIKRYFEKYID